MFAILHGFLTVLTETWDILLASAIYVLFGILIAGLLKMFLSPETVAKQLGKGRFLPVIKAAFFGIPIPLCSCGVLPAAASLRKQGANRGATVAFLISTPESGVDSIAISYALLDPIMTVARPLVAFVTAFIAGISENFMASPDPLADEKANAACPVDGCCDGENCPPEQHRHHHSFFEKVRTGMRYSFSELWGDLAGWFFIGLLLAGIITAAVPEDLFSSHLGGGLSSMLIMLVIGIPLYICATASTPIAAALVLKGVSPGAALVFLLVGPATNLASLSVLVGFLGKRATVLYLAVIASVSVLAGLLLDQIYGLAGISPQAVIGQAGEVIPGWLQFAGAVVLLILSIRPLTTMVKRWIHRLGVIRKAPTGTDNCCSDGCSR
ncbi:MAG: SO_0444 family Cu/Zn efflux transporter [Deltaproteobacteria bacterium]|nr:SO_0444 family Cu/Zn efflux transporter [Deltaproteobacteria bacterium]